MLQASALRRWIDDEVFDVIHYKNVSLLGGPAKRYSAMAADFPPSPGEHRADICSVRKS